MSTASPYWNKQLQVASLEKGAAHYRRHLTGAGLDYVRGRGISDEVAALLELGYGNPERPVTMAYDRLHVEGAMEVGLIYGEDTDAMSGRITFPIRDALGRMVGLTGRAIDDSEPKRYLNTRTTAVGLSCGQELYGLRQASDAIELRKRVLLVEGPIDVAVAWTFGLRHTVGTLGVSMVPKQHTLLLRTGALQLDIMFDNPKDKTAQEEMAKTVTALKTLMEEKGMTVTRMQLPPGKDPAEYLLGLRKGK